MCEDFSQDITFCHPTDCEKKETCHRYIGCKKKIASYSDFQPLCNHSNDYPYYLQARDTDIQAYKEKKGIKEKS